MGAFSERVKGRVGSRNCNMKQNSALFSWIFCGTSDSRFTNDMIGHITELTTFHTTISCVVDVKSSTHSALGTTAPHFIHTIRDLRLMSNYAKKSIPYAGTMCLKYTRYSIEYFL